MIPNMNNPHSRGWTIEGGRSQGRLAFLSVFFAIFQLLSSIFAPRAQAQTSVLFPLQQMFGSMNYALPFTIATTNTSITGNGNLYVGQTLIVTPAGTNPIVQLTPNVYSLTFQDGQFPLYFTVPSTNVVVNVINLITNGLSTFPGWTGGGSGLALGSSVIGSNGEAAVWMLGVAADGTVVSNAVPTGGSGGGIPSLSGTNVAIYTVNGSNQFNVPTTAFVNHIELSQETNASGVVSLGTIGGNVGQLRVADSFGSIWDTIAGNSNGVLVTGNVAVSGGTIIGNLSTATNLPVAAITGLGAYLSGSNYVTQSLLAGSNFVSTTALSGSNYLVGVTAGGGSTNLTGVNAAGAQVVIPWAGLPTGGGTTPNAATTNNAATQVFSGTEVFTGPLAASNNATIGTNLTISAAVANSKALITGDFSASSGLNVLQPADYVTPGAALGLSRQSDGAIADGLYSYQNTGNVNANLAETARNDMVFLTGGGFGSATERMRITSSGVESNMMTTFWYGGNLSQPTRMDFGNSQFLFTQNTTTPMLAIALNPGNTFSLSANLKMGWYTTGTLTGGSQADTYFFTNGTGTIIVHTNLQVLGQLSVVPQPGSITNPFAIYTTNGTAVVWVDTNNNMTVGGAAKITNGLTLAGGTNWLTFGNTKANTNANFPPTISTSAYIFAATNSALTAELFTMDGAGTVKQFSEHAIPDAPPSIVDTNDPFPNISMERNDYFGIVRWINRSREAMIANLSLTIQANSYESWIALHAITNALILQNQAYTTNDLTHYSQSAMALAWYRADTNFIGMSASSLVVTTNETYAQYNARLGLTTTSPGYLTVHTWGGDQAAAQAAYALSFTNSLAAYSAATNAYAANTNNIDPDTIDIAPVWNPPASNAIPSWMSARGVQ